MTSVNLNSQGACAFLRLLPAGGFLFVLVGAAVDLHSAADAGFEAMGLILRRDRAYGGGGFRPDHCAARRNRAGADRRQAAGKRTAEPKGKESRARETKNSRVNFPGESAI